MKITVTPTEDQSKYNADCCHCTVSIEHPHDDLNLEEFMTVVRQLCLAVGYNEKHVDAYWE